MSIPTPTTLPPLQGRYRIEDRLGVSRLAVVYRAYDERLHRAVLVYLLRREIADQPAMRERFLQEAQYGAARSHQSLLDIYDTGELAGRPFLITEYVEGRTLHELGALSLEDAILYFRQVVGAVSICQSVGAPHPPISSTNLILVEDGHVELVEHWLTPPEAVALDLAYYRPPERAVGAPPSAAGVVYSLGLLLLELISGKRPVSGADARSVAQAHLSITLPTLAMLQPKIHAPALEHLIQQATARDPEQRLPNATALAQAIDTLLLNTSGDTGRLMIAPPPTVGERVRNETSRILRTAPAPVRRMAAPTAEELPEQPSPVTSNRSMPVLALIGVIFLIVVCGAYNLGSIAVEHLADIRLPHLTLPVLDVGVNLPGWLTGEVEGPGLTLEVSIPDSEGLNMRDAPGLTTQIITLLPNGTRVKRIDGPRVVDGVPWMQVRARIDGRDIEGWVSANYVKPV
jgi:serine/threonine protein kinase